MSSSIQAMYNAALPTMTEGSVNGVLCDVNGRLLVSSTLSIGTTALLGLADNVDGTAVSATANKLAIASRDYVFNGTSWDRSRKSNLVNRIASSAASGNPAFLKGSAGDLTQFWGQNGAAITYVQVYNKATAPTIGSDTPIITYPVAANAFFVHTLPNNGLYFATGIAYAFTTDAAATTGAAAAAVTSFAILGA